MSCSQILRKRLENFYLSWDGGTIIDAGTTSGEIKGKEGLSDQTSGVGGLWTITMQHLGHDRPITGNPITAHNSHKHRWPGSWSKVCCYWKHAHIHPPGGQKKTVFDLLDKYSPLTQTETLKCGAIRIRQRCMLPTSLVAPSGALPILYSASALPHTLRSRTYMAQQGLQHASSPCCLHSLHHRTIGPTLALLYHSGA